MPVGSSVTFYVTSTDLQHGFKLQDTNVNMQVVPGEVSKLTVEFDEFGEHDYICHEFCGIGHAAMFNLQRFETVTLHVALCSCFAFTCSLDASVSAQEFKLVDHFQNTGLLCDLRNQQHVDGPVQGGGAGHGEAPWYGAFQRSLDHKVVALVLRDHKNVFKAHIYP